MHNGYGSDLLLPRSGLARLPAAETPPFGFCGTSLGDHAGPHCAAAEYSAATTTTGAAAAAAVERPRGWSPYVDNGGTVLAVAGADYAIVAADTRLSAGFAVPTRHFTKISALSDRAVLASAGMGADRQYLHKILRTRMRMYRHQHQRDMKLTAAAQMLSNTLYSRRFFPIYAFNVMGGVDEHGEGFVFGYDAIGSYEKVKVVCSGTGQMLVQPVLDQQVEARQNYGAGKMNEWSLAQAVELVHDVFSSATERDIHTGDALQVYKITATGIETVVFPLKKD